MSPSAPAFTQLLTIAAALALTACNVGGRQGPPFAEAFPDATLLVTTSDPLAVRLQLDTVQLPATTAHNDRLLELLRSQTQISAAHLSLLTRAVATENHIVCSTGTRQWCYGTRGRGQHAAVIDQLLTEGADKISNIDRQWFGELIGVSQSDATLRLYVDRFLARVDDGSDQALTEMLAAMPGSPTTMPFLVEHLAPQGRLDGERGWLTFATLSFDSDRTALLRALAARKLPIDGDRLVRVMKAYSFDAGREEAFALLVAAASPLDDGHTRAAIATFSFDSGRAAACAALGRQDTVHITESQLAALMRPFSFDSGRLQCVQTLAGRVFGESTIADAKAILRTFSFDSDRVQATKVMAARWQQLPLTDRLELLDTFTFESGKNKGTSLLMK